MVMAMYRFLFIISCLMVASCGAGSRMTQVEMVSLEDNPEFYSQNTLIIMYDTEIGKEPLLKAIKAYKAEVIYDYNITPAIAIRIPEGTDIHDAIAYFKKTKGVVSVERDRIYRLTDPVRPRLEPI